jgi:hypothetical protein
LLVSVALSEADCWENNDIESKVLPGCVSRVRRVRQSDSDDDDDDDDDDDEDENPCL